MSNEALRWAWSEQVTMAMKDIPARNGSRGLTRFVLVRLADRAGPDNVSFASYERLAHECSLSRMGVVKAVDQLLQRGLIRKQVRAAKARGGRRATRYELMVINSHAINDLQNQSTPDRLWMEERGIQSTSTAIQSTSGVPDPSALPSALRKKKSYKEKGTGEGVLKLVSDGERRPPQREWHDGAWREPGWHRKGE